MKNIMLFANVNGNMKLLIEAMKFEQQRVDIMNSICLGNLPVMVHSTSQSKFYSDPKRLREASKAKRFFRRPNHGFPLNIFAMYGQHDDAMASALSPGELKSNVQQMGQSAIVPFLFFKADKPDKISYVPSQKTFHLGMLSGYYSPELLGQVNESKEKRQRTRAANVLSEVDFALFRRQLVDFIMTFESPDRYDHGNVPGSHQKFTGCKRITRLVKETPSANIHFHANAGTFSIGYIDDMLSVGVPKLEDGYMSLDLFDRTVDFIERKDGEFILNKTIKNNLRIGP